MISDKTASLPELCEIVGLSKAQIQQFVKDGMPRHGHGKYQLQDCIPWIVRRYRDTPAGSQGLDLERMKLYHEQRIKTELENEQTRRNAVPADAVVAAYDALAAATRQAHKALAADEQFYNELVAMTDPAMAERRITAEMRRIRDDIARQWLDWARVR